MTKYAKIKDNSLEYAPRNKGNISNWINDEKAVLADGYLPVELQDIPEDKYQVGYEVVNNKIVYKLKEYPKYEPKPLTKVDVEQNRKQFYIDLVDPITSHIQRLRDEEQTEETMTKIEALIKERSALVEEIKANNPYPAVEEPLVEPIEEIEELPVVEEATISETEKVDIVD